MTFELSNESLDAAALAASIGEPRAGAKAVFEGLVRNHDHGRGVSHLEYEAYPELALAEGERILAEAGERFGLIEARAIHRLGPLEIGAMAVWVGVTSAHRRESFAACRFIIDQLKLRVPIWKKQVFTDGSSEWVRCDACAAAPFEQRFARQSVLAEVGTAGQERLRQAAVLIVGVGGLGCVVAPALAAAGIDRIGLVEPDRIEASNLHRQTLYGPGDIHRLKVDVAATRIAEIHPEMELSTLAEPFGAEHGELVRDYDVVVDCTDNLVARLALNRAALAARVPLVSAAVHRYEGQLQVVEHGRGGCLECLWPEAPDPSCVGSCATAGVLGPIPTVLGAMQATEVLKILLYLPRLQPGRLALIDLLELDFRLLDLPHRPECKACGDDAESPSDGEWPLEVQPRQVEASGYRWIDIREAVEIELSSVDRAELMPLSTFDADRLDPEEAVILVCATGRRSLLLASRLRARGFARVSSLRGGLAALMQR